MLTAEPYDDRLSWCETTEFEVHRCKISLHCEKAGFDYPIVRLHHRFSALAGLPTCIFQTIYRGALAFLVVIAPIDASHNVAEEYKNNLAKAKSSIFTQRL
jgi:hypothetical protein